MTMTAEPPVIIEMLRKNDKGALSIVPRTVVPTRSTQGQCLTLHDVGETIVLPAHLTPGQCPTPHDPKTEIASLFSEMSTEAQKDMVGMHAYVLRSATMLYGACCFLYPLMCLTLLLMVSEQTRDDFIRQPPAWVSIAAMYVYGHGFGAYFAVLVCSHVCMRTHSTTHHAISKCAEMVTGRDTTEVKGLFGSTKTTGSTLSTLIQCLFVLLFVAVVGFMGWWFYVTYVVSDKADNIGSWAAGKVNSLGVGLWSLGSSLWRLGSPASTTK